MQTWKFLNRSTWNKGPWDKEPHDKAVWKDSTTGLDCMVHRGRSGCWCGYVGVPRSHKLFGDNYDQQNNNLIVHGGLTFSSECGSLDETGEGICHPADDGDHVWWFGFDCFHCGYDLSPVPELASISGPEAIYKDLDYVTEEVTSLAQQLASLVNG